MQINMIRSDKVYQDAELPFRKEKVAFELNIIPFATKYQTQHIPLKQSTLEDLMLYLPRLYESVARNSIRKG